MHSERDSERPNALRVWFRDRPNPFNSSETVYLECSEAVHVNTEMLLIQRAVQMHIQRVDQR